MVSRLPQYLRGQSKLMRPAYSEASSARSLDDGNVHRRGDGRFVHHGRCFFYSLSGVQGINAGRAMAKQREYGTMSKTHAPDVKAQTEMKSRPIHRRARA